jgi:predicted 3-demethylubiquinone-9 3-methyltransferase (glyoxalase superfamily)
MQGIQRITPCLWFDDQAEEAAGFYTTVFKNSRIVRVSRYGEAGRDVHGKPAGSVMVVAFELDGQAFTALNGGPVFLLGAALAGRRREGPAVRLAQGPIRRVVADRARPLARDAR